MKSLQTVVTFEYRFHPV